jgi:hypothetical protein
LTQFLIRRYESGNALTGIIYIVYGILLVIIENVDYGFGLYYPNDSFSYVYKISPFSIINFVLGIYGCIYYVTVVAGGCLITTAIVQGNRPTIL